MLSQLGSKLNTQKLCVRKLGGSHNVDLNFINRKKQFPRFKSPLRFPKLSGNHPNNQESLSECQEIGDRAIINESPFINLEEISSISITEDDATEIRTRQNRDINPVVTSSNAAGNEISKKLQSINTHNIEAQGIKQEKNILERIINIKKQFPRFRSPFRIGSATCNSPTHKESISAQKTRSNKTGRKVASTTEITTINSTTIGDQLIHSEAVQCGDCIPAFSSSKGTTQKFVEHFNKDLRIENKRTVSESKKPLNENFVIASGDSKIEKNQSKFNLIHASTHEGIITNHTDRQTTSDIRCSAKSTSHLKSHSRLGFSSRTSGVTSHTSYVAMVNTEGDEFENIKRITERRFRGLERQFKCKIMLSNKPCEMRAKTVYKLEIRGPTFREVIKCRNALPKFITEKLITEAETSREEEGYFFGNPRRD